MFRGVTELYAPASYWEATPEEKAEVCNGCGVAGWKGRLVPNRIWWLDVREACNIHDWMYKFGKTEEDRKSADRVLLYNLLRLIEARGGMLAGLRRYRAMSYYNAVSWRGGPAYWANKNPSSTLGLVYV